MGAAPITLSSDREGGHDGSRQEGTVNKLGEGDHPPVVVDTPRGATV